MEHKLVHNGVKKVQFLPAVNDHHGGVIIELEEHMDPNVFHNMLRSSLRQWKLQGEKGVWIKLPIELVNLVETVVKEGFWYHHAEPHCLMLVSIRSPKMPHIEWMLVVQESSGRMKETGIWKIPTGVIEEGEDIFEGAVREVKEETGIDTEFVEVLAFRQMHKSFFGKSDLFFICMMRPLTFNLQKQDLEIEAAQWMSLEEYAAQPFVLKHGIMKYIKDLCLAKAEGHYLGFTPMPVKSFLDDPMSYLYFNEDGLSRKCLQFIFEETE
ncbi:unnamed protein product [Withania somnifera]